jgi:TRAP-type C4-dicarboxylate transport system permease small subunit
MGWIADILSIGIWGLIAWSSMRYAWVMWGRNELQDPLDIPIAPFRFIWSIALYLLCLAVVATLFKTLMQEKKE